MYRVWKETCKFRKNRQTKCLADMTSLHWWGMLWAPLEHDWLVTWLACFVTSSIVLALACYLYFGCGMSKFTQGVNISCICGIFFVLYRISRKDIISLDMLSICLLMWSRQKKIISRSRSETSSDVRMRNPLRDISKILLYHSQNIDNTDIPRLVWYTLLGKRPRGYIKQLAVKYLVVVSLVIIWYWY